MSSQVKAYQEKLKTKLESDLEDLLLMRDDTLDRLVELQLKIKHTENKLNQLS